MQMVSYCLEAVGKGSFPAFGQVYSVKSRQFIMSFPDNFPTPAGLKYSTVNS
jgi:hypothetical protein